MSTCSDFWTDLNILSATLLSNCAHLHSSCPTDRRRSDPFRHHRDDQPWSRPTNTAGRNGAVYDGRHRAPAFLGSLQGRLAVHFGLSTGDATGHLCAVAQPRIGQSRQVVIRKLFDERFRRTRVSCITLEIGRRFSFHDCPVPFPRFCG
jgi:hypothetical protein